MVYTGPNLQNVIADTTKQTQALLQCKFEKLVDAKVPLQGAFFLDTLAKAKKD